MKTAREAAVQALLRVDAQGAYSQLAIDGVLKASALDPRNAALASAIFYGTLERRMTLDHCIEHYARHRLTLTVREILRSAFYQLLYLDGVPSHAVVDEAVSLTRTMREPNASGLVNGVLRSFLRDNLVIPEIKGSAAKKLSVRCSCREDLAQSLIGWYGEEKAKEILARSMGRPPVYLRTNTTKTTADGLAKKLSEAGLKVMPGPISGAITCLGGDVAHTKFHQAGLFHIQDVSSQLAAVALGPRPGERVLDVCAAPGSKSFTIAELMGDQGEVVSCDVFENKVRQIEAGAQRLGLTCIRAVINDATVEREGFGVFDRILCDVPCSGLGVIRRKPEIKYKAVSTFSSLPGFQYKILEMSTHYLKPGGELVYSTCTIDPEENERVVGRFLEEHPDYSPVPWNEGSFFRLTLPGEENADGFFISKIRREQ